MDAITDRAIAIVGVGALLPDAPDARSFWNNIVRKRYSIIETPADRWRIGDYYDPDPAAPDKTYSKIGGWVRGFQFDWQRFRIPPKVAAAMDESQQWAVTIAAEALAGYGFPDRPLNTENTGVILGTAMGGEQHYLTTQRIVFPEFAKALRSTAAFQSLAPNAQAALIAQFHEQIRHDLPGISEDTMPGELANIVAGRVANVLNLRGPNFIADAACASTFAAIDAAVEMLSEGHVDAVLAGGVDRNMGVATFVKFCKIGALSATGTRPFGDGADGFVMGEGAAVFLLKRLADAERNGDTIYAVIRGVGGSSDGKGKGITAPNPLGQVYAIERAWRHAGLDPATATLVEAHGTSTRVGDVVEVESLAKVFGRAERGTIGLGSAKSNIGHLKAGAGAAGLLKTVFALHEKILPPTLNCEQPNPNLHLDATPFTLIHEPRQWERQGSTPRRAGVSAYGFGGTNFHLVLEEYVPGMLKTEPARYPGYAGATPADPGQPSSGSAQHTVSASWSARVPLRGMLALGASTPLALKERLEEITRRVEGGWAPAIALPDRTELRQPERLVIDYADQPDLLDKLAKARKAAGIDTPPAWKALQAQGVFRGSGAAPGKIAFLFPGQGSQYLNMGRELAARSAGVAQVFAEADQVMTPILGRPLTSYIFVDADDPNALKQAERDLMQTAITQPAMLTLDAAIYRLLGEYGFGPDLVMGHSLGEYAALVASGIMPFAQALEAAAARGNEMTKVSMADNGWMAAVMAPIELIKQTIAKVDGYVVAANMNSYSQAVIGGESKAVQQAIELFTQQGFQAQRIPVSHAFHTRIVAPASKPLRQLLDRFNIAPPTLPLVANVTGELYPTTIDAIKELLEQQIASPVLWYKGLETLYREGARTFVEVGPKKALKGFVDDVLGSKADVVSLFTNHPKTGEIASFNQALCGLYAAGYGIEQPAVSNQQPAVQHPESGVVAMTDTNAPQAPAALDGLAALLQALQSGLPQAANQGPQRYDRNDVPLGSVVISGTGLGLPGAEKPVMDPENVMRILRGEQFVDLIPERFRNRMAHKHVTRLIKDGDGGGHFETIDDPALVIRLAGRPGSFNLTDEYGVPAALVEAFDITTQLAMAAGIDALREAGIPLVRTYRATSKGGHLPDRWMLPEPLRDETGVIFASAFPGIDRMAEEFERFYTSENLCAQLAQLEELRLITRDEQTLREIGRRTAELREQQQREPYTFDRRFVFRVLAMGHSQFAEYIGARGPNTAVNAACASTTQGLALAEDWIRNGRCRRVLVIGADAATSDHLMEWVGAGFLATGAAATDDRVEDAVLPFDRRRHGTILGMGACALVVESEDAVRERGMRAIVELLSSETANSAYHGTRLDVDHISKVMESLVMAAERRFGVDRYAIAGQLVFVSHETFTPARGGSAAAEVTALRKTFGDAANQIIVANTKGFTGHPMGVGVEDVIAVKILEHGIVPPVPNLKEVDPDLGPLTLSKGGRYPVQYAIHMAAGFGSQLALTLLRRIPGSIDRVEIQPRYDYWLSQVSGYDRPQIEVIKRTLRVKADAAPTRLPVPNDWRPGTGPSVRASAPGQLVAVSRQPSAVSYQQPGPRIDLQHAVAVGGNGHAPMTAVSRQPSVVSSPESGISSPESAVSSPEPVAKAEPVPAVSHQPSAVSQQEPVAKAEPVLPTPQPVVPELRPLEPAIDPVQQTVLAIIAQQTGYPPEMLDLDLDLEADLGVDTVKQAETFQAVRVAFDIPRVEGLRLRDYPTLASVIRFVYEQRPELRPAVSHQPSAVSNQEPGVRSQESVAKAEPVLPTPDPVVPELRPSEPGVDPVQQTVLAIIAEQTGYPPEMLDLDLDLEADLGVDTVKQAETFQAVRVAFDIPRVEGLRLRDYPTLASVIRFVYEQRPELRPAVSHQPSAARSQESGVRSQESVAKAEPVLPTPQPMAPEPHPSEPGVDPVQQTVLAIIAEQTGYPPEMLDLDLDLEADLGVDTVKQAETFQAVRVAFDIPRVEGLRLRDYPTLASVIRFVYEQRPELRPAVSHQPSAISSQESGVSSSTAASSSIMPEAAMSSPSATPAVDPVQQTVLAIIAEQTGYPPEMLDLDLDLEADLGVDTVKQAETFQAVRTAFNIPRVEGLQLRDYPTLASVIRFVYEQRPDLRQEPRTKNQEPSGAPPTIVAAPQAAMPEMQAPVTVPAVDPLLHTQQPAPRELRSVADADKAPRRVPIPALRPPIELCKPTSVSLAAGSRVIVMLDQAGIGKALVNRLEKRGVVTLLLEQPVTLEALTAQIQSWLSEGPITGIYWLPALDNDPRIEDMTLEHFRERNQSRVKNLAITMRLLYQAISGPGTFLISGTRLGGLHGYGPEGASAPLGGAVTGFTKAYKRERPDVLVKAVDFELSRKTAEPADALIAETLADPGVVEVGYQAGTRFGITLEEQPAADGQPGMLLNQQSVFVVSGAAGGITSAIVEDLASASGGIFYLLDLTPVPDPADPNIALFRSDKEALKHKLIEDLKAAGEKPTPVMVDRRIAGLERSDAALRAIEAVRAAGGTPHYRSVNLLDGAAVAAVVEEVRQQHGRIDVLLHAGGIEISRPLDVKEQREFDMVFDIKADGFFSLLKAAQGMPIGATVAFSSVAGRFGNAAQTDYSSANDLLCKITSSMRSWRPETRAIVIDWTAWGGIGMATRGSIPKMMEMAGIDMLPPEIGLPTIRRELTAGGRRGELVVGQRLGILVAEFDPDGGLDLARAQQALAERQQPLLMVGKLTSCKLYGGLTVETTLDPQQQPFLYDHQIDGVPLLPGVMGTEAFAELASVLAPGYQVAEIRAEQFHSPFKFHRQQPRTLYLSAIITVGMQGELLAHTELHSVTQPRPELPPTRALHFSAEVRLTRESRELPVAAAPCMPDDGRIVTNDAIYRVYFHGPAYQVLEQVALSGDQAVGLMAATLPANSSPADAAALIEPRLIEFCFQTAGIWEVANTQRMALPLAIGSVRCYRPAPHTSDTCLYALVTAIDNGASFDAQVVDQSGQVYIELCGYRTVQLPGTASL